MNNLPEAFLTRMRAQLGAGYTAFVAEYAKPPVRGLRVNTLKCEASEFEQLSPWPLAPSSIARDSFVLCGNTVGLGTHPYHMAGLFYAQEPSAALPVAIAGIEPGMRVLDLCAAPGGKSGAAAAALMGEGFLLANEIIPSRAKTLVSTLERMGVTNAAVTCASPEAIAEAFPRYFDVVLVDAPCSGEGMFRKEPAAVAEWSREHVASCALRQQKILNTAAACVRGGGALVYSTCTFSPEENEGNVKSFLGSNSEFVLEEQHMLYPHECVGEGHFAARLRLMAEGFAPQDALRLKPCRDKAYLGFIDDTFTVAPRGEACLLPDGRVTLLASHLPAGLEGLRVLSSGVMAGELVKGRFEPAHTLFMAAHGGEYARKLSLAAASGELAAFLSGDTLHCPEGWRGYCAVAADGFTLGFGKADHGTFKNRLPKGLRVRLSRETRTCDS